MNPNATGLCSLGLPATAAGWMLLMVLSHPLVSVGAPGAGDKVRADFSLAVKDGAGRMYRPFQLEDGVRASILFFVTSDCPVANKYAREIQRIAKEYKPRKIKSCLVYVDPDMTTGDMAGHMKDFGHDGLTSFLDKRHRLVKAVGATVTPEAAEVVGDGKIAYRGRIDNFYEKLGVGRRQVTRRDLRDALEAILKGQQVTVPRTKAVGCFIADLN